MLKRLIGKLFGSSDQEAASAHDFIGPQAEEFKATVRTKWNYDEGYWDPLSESSPTEVIYLYEDVIFEYESKILQLIKSRDRTVYFYGECGCQQYDTDRIKWIFAHESIVTNPELEWIIYRSHEATVTFGGDWLIRTVREVIPPDKQQFINTWGPRKS